MKLSNPVNIVENEAAAMLVSLLTDFGLQDTYVGQMKAALLAVAPAAALVDLTHTVPAQDVQAGAFLLAHGVEVFPGGSVHLAVVDPGVGSARRAVAARAARGDLFVGPDNGLLVPALDRLGGLAAAVELRDPAFWRHARPSSTFHGRDIFAPVAGHLANGVPLERVGPTVDLLRAFELPKPDGPLGEVVYVDGYGNLVTNLPAESLPERYVVVLGQQEIQPRPHYQAVAPGELLALIGSSGLLEISARDASAADKTGAGRGARIHVQSA
jgi:S-adenosyl-L-methionine hydrolase (adenosine-forming)